MPEQSHRFFQNTACAYFPCHKVEDRTQFNCLFCFCPLYWLEDCGGSPAMRGAVKDCTGCTLPHGADGYDAVLARLKREFARRKEQETPATDSSTE